MINDRSLEGCQYNLLAVELIKRWSADITANKYIIENNK